MIEGKPYSRREFLKIAAAVGAAIGVGAGLGDLLAACGGEETATSTVTYGSMTTTTTLAALEPIVVPTMPDKIPGSGEVDPATGLHVRGTPQVIDLASYRLAVGGSVAKELSLTYDDLRRLPKVTATATTDCPGAFKDTTTWSGVPLHIVLEMAGVQTGANRIVMTSADRYSTTLSLDEALRPESFLAYEWTDKTLPVLQGFPLRAVIPGHYGSAWVKWLLEIVVK